MGRGRPALGPAAEDHRVGLAQPDQATGQVRRQLAPARIVTEGDDGAYLVAQFFDGGEDRRRRAAVEVRAPFNARLGPDFAGRGPGALGTGAVAQQHELGDMAGRPQRRRHPAGVGRAFGGQGAGVIAAGMVVFGLGVAPENQGPHGESLRRVRETGILKIMTRMTHPRTLVHTTPFGVVVRVWPRAGRLL